MTIPKECKRLAEVDFPIAAVSKHAVREKSIRHGHPSTLHLWWARRPLASSRAMLMALLLPDPADPHCPPEFRTAARRILTEMTWRPPGWAAQIADDAGLRKGLLQFIGDFADWDKAADAVYLAAARALVKAAHPDETPLVVDPFAGGGSIPLEALRVGCDAFASDLNPVAVLINKVMLEDIPRYGKAKIKVKNAAGEEVEADGLAAALRIAGAAVKAAAEKELAAFYPPDTDGSRPIAYLWARTVRCEAPNCGAEIPLVRSFWLAKKANRKRALRYTVRREQGQPPHLEFEVFEPKKESEVPDGTVSRARATCPCCNMVLSPERVKAQLTEQSGGGNAEFDSRGRRVAGAMLLTVVLVSTSQSGRTYRVSKESDYKSIVAASARIKTIQSDNQPDGLSPVPNEELPFMSGTFNVPLYGMSRWGLLFTDRQTLTLVTISDHIRKYVKTQATNSAVIERLLAIALDRCVDYSTTLCGWHLTRELIGHTFGRQALGMIWDFSEANLISGTSGNFDGAVNWIANVAGNLAESLQSIGQTQIADSRDLGLPSGSANVVFTDPPYYFAVPYADLSDFFYVWLKRTLSPSSLIRDPYDADNPLTPKTQELCEMARWDPVRYQHKDKGYFEHGMAEAFAEAQRVVGNDGIMSVVFAHKTTEGWEALLSSIIQSGWTLTGSWPISTEMGERLRARDSAALATSIHLVCRTRVQSQNTGDWIAVIRELPRRVSTWMTRLEAEGIRGADLVFACIGPALELYSQYSQVVDAEDRPIPLGGDPTASEPHRRGYLAYVWETVARLALEQVLGTGAGQSSAAGLEEDARLTALFLWTLQATDESGETTEGAEVDTEDAEETEEDEEEGSGGGRKAKGLSLPFDVARRFAQPLGIHLDVWQGRVIAIDKGVVRLLPVGERARQLFGAEGADAVAGELERSPLRARDLQLGLFAEQPAPVASGRGRARVAVADDALGAAAGSTTLDRVHAAMLLQKSGRTNALRALLTAEQERGPAFLRLANALSGLYPRASEEKRLLDAMLLAYPK